MACMSMYSNLGSLDVSIWMLTHNLAALKMNMCFRAFVPNLEHKIFPRKTQDLSTLQESIGPNIRVLRVCFSRGICETCIETCLFLIIQKSPEDCFSQEMAKEPTQMFVFNWAVSQSVRKTTTQMRSCVTEHSLPVDPTPHAWGHLYS